MFFERLDSGNRAILVHVDLVEIDHHANFLEFCELATSAGATICESLRLSRQTPHPKYFIGSGKVDELRLKVIENKADLILFNHTLSPAQERNIEKVIQTRVLDRTGLILDIFAQRARTHEGKLQVELAQLQYQSTRLIRGWTHLERQKGGIGLRGPGETQLETDRRLLKARMTSIYKRLEKVSKQRNQSRRARAKSDMATVSLVGYTNAGKSTLFNRMTHSDVYAADQLFATLDPTLRKVEVPDVGHIVLADTVGFISNLPHKLIDAFKATLQETTEANLLLHVVDSVDENRLETIDQVERVLDEIKASHLPCLQVFNKIDLFESMPAKIERDMSGTPIRVWLSSKTGEGCDLLLQCISELVADTIVEYELKLDPNEAAIRSAFYEVNAVLVEDYDELGCFLLRLRIQQKTLKQMMKKFHLKADRFRRSLDESFY